MSIHPYDMYAKYRTALTPEESTILAEAEKKAPEEGKVPPLVKAHIQIACKRAETQFSRWPAMPENEEASIRYPGVDPMGHYSVIDMAFAERFNKLHSVLQSRSPEVQQYIGKVHNHLMTQEKTKNIQGEMQRVSKEHRIMTRASKLALDPQARSLLHQQSRMLQTSPAVAEYDLMLQGLEHIAGIRKGPVPKDVADFYEKKAALTLDPRILSESHKNFQNADMTMGFEDVSHRLTLHQFANPECWNLSPAEAAEKAPSTTQDFGVMVPPYLRTSADRLLNPIYSSLEDSMKLPGGQFSDNFSRGDLILIDGKTVREQMRDRYLETHEMINGFQTYYNSQFRTVTAELVSTALMAGKSVQAFIPDEKGMISEKPVTIQAAGYRPDPEEKITMNLWERIFSKCGFYKEKLERVRQQEQRDKELADVQKLVKLRNELHLTKQGYGLGGPARNQYYRLWEQEHPNTAIHNPCRLSLSRSALTSICKVALLGENHSLQDICDSTKLQNEKQLMGKKILENIHNNNMQAVSLALCKGLQKVEKIYNDPQNLHFFTNNRDLQLAEGREFQQLGYAVFDVTQEVNKFPDDFKAAVNHIGGDGEKYFNFVTYNLSGASRVMTTSVEAMEGEINLASRTSELPMNAVGKSLLYQGIHQFIHQQRQNNPQLPAVECLKFTDYVTLSSTLTSNAKGIDPIMDQFVTNPYLAETYGKEMQLGDLQSKFQFSEIGSHHPKLTLKVPEKMKTQPAPGRTL